MKKKIACRRKSLNLDEISLYPKGKHIGHVATIMEKKLRHRGVKFIKSNKSLISKKNGDINLTIQEAKLYPDLIFIVTELDDMLNFFTEKITDKKNNHYVSQVFIYFSVENVISDHQYVHGNDINLLINRINNLSLYGEKTFDGKNVISVEMPTEINSDLWNNPEKYLPKIWEEVKKMKFVKKNERYISYKIFNIPKTLSVPLLNFEDSKRKLLNHIKTNYQNKIETPGLGVITRKKFIESTNNLIKKYE